MNSYNPFYPYTQALRSFHRTFRTVFLAILFTIFYALSMGCSQSESPSEMKSDISTEMEEDTLLLEGGNLAQRSANRISESPTSPAKNYDSSGKDRTVKPTKYSGSQDPKIQFAPLNVDLDRLLEYTVQLEFESTDFDSTRERLYQLAGEYGFLQSSHDRFEKKKTIHASIWVRRDKLYDFLQIANELGKLRSEEIRTDDLTYDNFQKEVVLAREAIRGSRRARALGQTDTKTYAERERLLTDSENREDNAKIEKWQIQDRVTWAKINIQVIDPRTESKIAVPDFANIFYDFVSGFLYLLYIGIYLLPIALLGWVLWKKTNLFRKKS